MSTKTSLNIGDELFYAYKDFDGSDIVEGTISEICEDHLIMEDELGISYWCDLENGGLAEGFYCSRDAAETYFKNL